MNVFCTLPHHRPEDCHCIPTESSLSPKNFTPEHIASFVTAACNRLLKGIGPVEVVVKPTEGVLIPDHITIRWYYASKEVARVRYEPSDKFPWRVDVTTIEGATYSTYNKREEAMEIVSTVAANISRHGLRVWLASNYECL